jgi:hypothetical protein
MPTTVSSKKEAPMTKRRLWFGVVCLALVAALIASIGVAWSSGPWAVQHRVFPPFEGVTKVVVARQSREVQTITEPEAIRRIVDFVNGHLGDWEVPWTGVPVPGWDVRLYSRDAFLGHFGAGDGFFETQRSGGFYSKRASEGEVLAFNRLIGAD